MDKIKTIVIDTEKGIVNINGQNLSSVSYFNLTFDGSWRLNLEHCFRCNGDAFKPENYQSPDKRAIDEYLEMLNKDNLIDLYASAKNV